MACLVLLFAVVVYIGLHRFLENTLQESLARQAEQVASTVIYAAPAGDSRIVDEINEHHGSESSNGFMRVSRADGSIVYISREPSDQGFDPAQVQAAKAFRRIRQESLKNGTKLLVYSENAKASDGQQFLIEVGAPVEQVNNVMHGLLLSLAIGLPFTVAVAVIGGYLLMRNALKPLDQIAAGAERITSRNLKERMPVAKTGDELEQLSTSLNRMIARLEDAFHHINRFSADASHELRTPLTIMRGELEAVVQEPSLRSDIRDQVASVLEETQRLSKVVDQLLAVSRLDAGEAVMDRTRFDLSETTRTTLEHMRLLAEEKNIAVSLHAIDKVEIDGDRSRVKQVLVNLLDNAIKYTPKSGSVEVAVFAKEKTAVLEVRDSGIGIPSEALPHVFDRFYRSDKARSRQFGGAGLGLSIVKSICTAHGGQVTVQSHDGNGTTFRVEFPLSVDGKSETNLQS
jgi:heavy metal sensor kinase